MLPTSATWASSSKSTPKVTATDAATDTKPTRQATEESGTDKASETVGESKHTQQVDNSSTDLRKRVVLDSGAVILGGRLERLGDEFWTVQDVLDEIKDENSRLALSTLPYELNVREVDPEAVDFVVKFSKLTGDFSRLSATDIKVIALTYQLEKQFYGTQHLHSAPKSNQRPRDQYSKDQEDSAGAVQEQAESEVRTEEKGTEAIDEDCVAALELNAEEGAGSDQSDEDCEPDDCLLERQPLFDAPADDGWTVVGGRRDDECASTHSSASRQGMNLPGWYNGEDEEAGWITPDNQADIVPAGCAVVEKCEQRGVACATTDYAMQNVLLQVGLRVLNMEGLVVKQARQFVLKCHACFKICSDATRLFCPACGNATLMRVAKYVDAEGHVSYTRGIKNFNLRGTRYTLPQPKQGRGKDDLVLREDQLLGTRRQHKPRAADPDRFQTFSPAARRQQAGSDQEILGMGFGGGGKRNPNVSRRRR
mmetsp:Transcript_39557/g.105188  ORF Transcript_39557/g.105188 Transcript_39557/m.105188 type:complete len:481 (-) Transcript_39557:361-1803(-)